MQIIKEDASFTQRAAAAMTVSVIADALDYFAAPLFDMPIVGDIFDVIITSLLYSMTKSKVSTAINTLEFIPVIGDFAPIYTISTLLWISRESKKKIKKRIGYKIINNTQMRG
jgi:hypothetical protein